MTIQEWVAQIKSCSVRKGFIHHEIQTDLASPCPVTRSINKADQQIHNPAVQARNTHTLSACYRGTFWYSPS